MLKHVKDIANTLLSIAWIRTAYVTLNRINLETLGVNRALIHLHYFANFLTFNGEQSAVIRGRRDYYRDKARPKISHVGLRRNIHRLEKALIMRPRRAVFASDYIVETVEFFTRMVQRCEVEENHIDIDELNWARDVLENYFLAISGDNSKVEAARLAFNSLPNSTKFTNPGSRIPRAKQKLSRITFDEMLALSEQRRSVRWFEDKEVPRELLDKAILVARQAPTACNRLPYEFRIFDQPELVQSVISLPFGAAGFGKSVKTVVVVVGKLSSYFSARDRHAIYVDSSLAAMSFVFALETLGLSSTLINWPDLEPLELKMRKTIGLDLSERVVMLIAVGYNDPTALVPFSQKKELDSIRSYNRTASKYEE
jgi:nitroreductase